MAARKTTPKKTAKKTAKKTTRKAATKVARKAAAKKGAEIGPEPVNMAHVFALRPRVAAAFSQEALRRAKDELREDRFESIQDAARAVATKALEISQKKPDKRGPGRR